MHLQITTIFFLVAMLLIFRISPGKLRKYMLILGSACFIWAEGKFYGLAAVILITLITWGSGILIFSDKEQGGAKAGRRRAAGFFLIAALALILFGLKYLPWIAALQGKDTSSGFWSFSTPVGLSFYTFCAISYIADLYAGKLSPERDLTNFALYLFWFPKFLSGPIERAGNFLDQLKYLGNIRPFSFPRITHAASYVVWGLVMKLMIADKIAVAVDHVHSDINSYGFAALFLTSLLYTIQIYCDFAGYSNIAIGISKLFGIDLTQNFRTPYLAENVSDFWNRWHISLSSFLRDYIYIPLGGNRRGKVRKYLNTIIVFLVCGLWHGTGLSFVVWGVVHGIFSTAADMLRVTPLRFLVKGVPGRIVTFVCVSFAWIFFRADSFTHAVNFLMQMVPSINCNAPLAGLEITEGEILSLRISDWWIVILSVLILSVTDICAYKNRTTWPELLIERVADYKRIVLLSLIMSLVLVFGEYGSGAQIREFVYMNF